VLAQIRVADDIVLALLTKVRMQDAWPYIMRATGTWPLRVFRFRKRHKQFLSGKTPVSLM
jgi:hypothetical protein